MNIDSFFNYKIGNLNDINSLDYLFQSSFNGIFGDDKNYYGIRNYKFISKYKIIDSYYKSLYFTKDDFKYLYSSIITNIENGVDVKYDGGDTNFYGIWVDFTPYFKEEDISFKYEYMTENFDNCILLPFFVSSTTENFFKDYVFSSPIANNLPPTDTWSSITHIIPKDYFKSNYNLVGWVIYGNINDKAVLKIRKAQIPEEMNAKIFPMNFTNYDIKFRINRNFTEDIQKGIYDIIRYFQNGNNYAFYKLGLEELAPKRFLIKGFDD